MKIFTKSFKTTFWISIIRAVSIAFFWFNYNLDVKDVSNPRQAYGGWVTDMVDMLFPEAEAKLNTMISDLEAKNGAEIAVVTVPNTRSSSTPKEFATELFNYWGIGKEGQDNGVLFLVSKSERQVEIETGYGIVPILPNAKVQEIIEREIIPQFKREDFEGGILAGTESLIFKLGGDLSFTSIVSRIKLKINAVFHVIRITLVCLILLAFVLVWLIFMVGMFGLLIVTISLGIKNYLNNNKNKKLSTVGSDSSVNTNISYSSYSSDGGSFGGGCSDGDGGGGSW